jgi:serine phosphatase RsbU (regulator of sigma subunit)
MDCTGHGVPGAFMSILGITLLNEIILYDRILSPEKILESLRDKIMNSLAQNEDKTIVKDGIEGSVVSYDTKKRILSYAGSYNPMLYIHKNNMEVIKADRIPIGYYEKKGKFTLKSIQVEKGDIIYLYTDGYIDQFGGPEIRKIMTKGFMVLLQKNHSLSMASQKSVLLDFLNHWKSNMDQTDDILVVGIRF